MAHDETSPLLEPQPRADRRASYRGKRRPSIEEQIAASEILWRQQHVALALASDKSTVNDYVTIDFLEDLVKDSYCSQMQIGQRSLRGKFRKTLDHASSWIVASVIGALTACVAYLVDIGEAVVSDWKFGYCQGNPFKTIEACCEKNTSSVRSIIEDGVCPSFKLWSTTFWPSFTYYMGFALVFGLISGSITMLTKHTFRTATAEPCANGFDTTSASVAKTKEYKTMYMASGSGIPELRTILAGFEIPEFLTFKVMAVKAVGAVFAVSTGMCLGKEGPFVHISACVGHQIAMLFSKYRDNERKMREILSAATAAGLSVAFGAPIGGVLFSYEEISTYFPRSLLWKAILCSLSAALVLRELNPTGTGRLVLFETKFQTTYTAFHYMVFVMLGVAGGIFGGAFCRSNFLWSKWFRSFKMIKRYPVLETMIVTFATVSLQYPNALARSPGDVIIRNIFVDCRDEAHRHTLVCRSEAQEEHALYYTYLISGTFIKFLLTVITFGVKIPSGIIIPCLNAGGYFGRFIGQFIPNMSPGIFAMVGAAAFLAGVSRMTISLGVIMLELTGELEYVVPTMVAILVAKFIADALCTDGVYELAQVLQGHPFLDVSHSSALVQGLGVVAGDLAQPESLEHSTIMVPDSNTIHLHELMEKLKEIKDRDLLNTGLILLRNNGLLCGHIDWSELESSLTELATQRSGNEKVLLLRGKDIETVALDLSHLVNTTPLTIPDTAPIEHVTEIFGQLGVRRLIITEQDTSRVMGVIDKRRLIVFLDALKG